MINSIILYERSMFLDKKREVFLIKIFNHTDKTNSFLNCFINQCKIFKSVKIIYKFKIDLRNYEKPNYLYNNLKNSYSYIKNSNFFSTFEFFNADVILVKNSIIIKSKLSHLKVEFWKNSKIFFQLLIKIYIKDMENFAVRTKSYVMQKSLLLFYKKRQNILPLPLLRFAITYNNFIKQQLLCLIIKYSKNF